VGDDDGMSHPSAVPGPQPVQIPERAHAVGPGWRQVLDRLHGQVHAIAPGYHLVGLTEKLSGCISRWRTLVATSVR
jgi:hypothetical protein